MSTKANGTLLMAIQNGNKSKRKKGDIINGRWEHLIKKLHRKERKNQRKSCVTSDFISSRKNNISRAHMLAALMKYWAFLTSYDTENELMLQGNET